MLLIPILVSCALAASQELSVPTARPLFGDWLRHESVVLDVAWVGNERLVTVDTAGTVTIWNRETRAREAAVVCEGAYDIETVAGLDGVPTGFALAYRGESPRVELRSPLTDSPTWTVEGSTGPIAVGEIGERVIAIDGEVVNLINVATGEARPVYEIGDWAVADVHFDRDDLAILTINRPKALGRAGTEFESSASLALVGALNGELRVVEPLEEAPWRVARLVERWIVFAEDARAWALSPSGGVNDPVELGSGPILCADDGGERLAAIGVDGILRSSTLDRNTVEVGGFVSRSAVQLVRSPTSAEYAVVIGTTVAIVDAEGLDRGGAMGPSAQVSDLAFAADGESLVVGSYDRSVRLVALADGRTLDRGEAAGIVHAVAYAPQAGGSGLWVARGGFLEARGYGEEGGERRSSADTENAPWTDLTVAGDRVVAGLAGGRMMVLDASSLEPVWSSSGARGAQPQVAAAGDSVVLGGSGVLHVSLEDGSKRGELGDLGAPVMQIALTADGTRGALGLASGDVATFELGEPSVVDTVANHRGRCSALALDPAGRRLASIGTNSDALQVTTLDGDGREVAKQELPWVGPPCTALAWSPDGRTLAAGRLDGAVIVYRFED
ncbi:MAG: hypothetical protein AAFZ65_03210 [Planctomycetota bacterium]